MSCPVRMSKVAVADPLIQQPTGASDLADRIILPHTHHDPFRLGPTQTDKPRPRRIWERTHDDMVSIPPEKRVHECVAEGNRPQVLNASIPMSPVSSGPPPDGDTITHETGAPLSHRDEHQITLDTDRSFVQYPSGEASLIVPPIRCAADETECSPQAILL